MGQDKNNMMNIRTFTFLLIALLPAVSLADEPAASPGPVAPYLLPGAPAFELNITQFREKFNQENPSLKINEFRAIDSAPDAARVTRAASKINENLYASSALERGTLKIKSMQITWLPIQGPEQKAAKEKAKVWMSAVLRVFTPGITPQQSRARLDRLLKEGKDKIYYAWSEGAVRYVVADNGEKGLTFAVEPIKLTLSGETIAQ